MSIDQQWMIRQRELDKKREELETRIADLYARGGYVAVIVIERNGDQKIGRRWSMQEAADLLPLGAWEDV